MKYGIRKEADLQNELKPYNFREYESKLNYDRVYWTHKGPKWK